MTTIDYRTVAQVLWDLPELVRGHRARMGLSLRDAAEEIGISTATLHRLEGRKGPGIGDTTTAAALLTWMGRTGAR